MATAGITICEGTIADLGVVDRIMAEAFDPRFGEAWTHSQCLGIMALPGVWLSIAHVQDEACGFALSRITLDEAELLLLATRPAQRGRGIGKALLRAVMHEASQRGAKSLHLEVREGNDALHLYKTAGFRKVGERRGYYRGNDGKSFSAFTYQLNIG